MIASYRSGITSREQPFQVLIDTAYKDVVSQAHAAARAGQVDLLAWPPPPSRGPPSGSLFRPADGRAVGSPSRRDARCRRTGSPSDRPCTVVAEPAASESLSARRRAFSSRQHRLSGPAPTGHAPVGSATKSRYPHVAGVSGQPARFRVVSSRHGCQRGPTSGRLAQTPLATSFPRRARRRFARGFRVLENRIESPLGIPEIRGSANQCGPADQGCHAVAASPMFPEKGRVARASLALATVSRRVDRNCYFAFRAWLIAQALRA